MNKFMKFAALAGATLLATGCAMQSPQYGCSGIPESKGCLSVTDTYEMTEGGNVPNKLISADQMESHEGHDHSSRSYEIQPTAETYVPVSAHDPLPIRTPAKVMRVWIAPWEDENKNLHVLGSPGSVFVEVESRKWTLGAPVAATQSRVQSLQVVKTSKFDDAKTKGSSAKGKRKPN